MKLKVLIIALVLCFVTSIAYGQYTLVPPIYTYQIQPPIIIPPPITVTVVPRPAFYTKTVRCPGRFRNIFIPWRPVYAIPVVPVISVPSVIYTR